MAETIDLLPNKLTANISHTLGDTFTRHFGWKAGDDYVDFTGCTVLAQIKTDKTGASLATLIVTLGDGSAFPNISLSLSNTASLDLGVGTFFYDVQIIHTDGSVRTYIEGKFKQTQDITR
jgi:hypothetical protein